jgi:hypothetical protein
MRTRKRKVMPDSKLARNIAPNLLDRDVAADAGIGASMVVAA